MSVETMELRIARLEEEVDALERQVEVLREEIRAIARAGWPTSVTPDPATG